MGSEQARDRLAAALVQLAEHGLPPDTAEELVQGNPRLGCPPGALAKVLTTAREQALREALQGLRMLALANGETASADWYNGVQAAIGEVSRLSLMERKA